MAGGDRPAFVRGAGAESVGQARGRGQPVAGAQVGENSVARAVFAFTRKPGELLHGDAHKPVATAVEPAPLKQK